MSTSGPAAFVARIRRAASDQARTRLSRQVSYAQCGEDLIAAFALEQLGIGDVRYLDIGANHPRRFSNTFLFYRRGHSGALVEPDPALSSRLRRERPRDVCLPVAAAGEDGQSTLHVMGSDTLNTTSDNQLGGYESEGMIARGSITVPALTPATLIERGLGGVTPDFVSLDSEGADTEVLEAWDFSGSRSPVFCIETLTFTGEGRGEKIAPISGLMAAAGYFALADTWINTIYVDAERW